MNLKTHKDVRYTWIPGSYSTTKEKPIQIPDGCFMGATFNLAMVCRLPPGTYALKLWYNTSQLYQVIPIDPRAWHGVTNSTTVTVKVTR